MKLIDNIAKRFGYANKSEVKSEIKKQINAYYRSGRGNYGGNVWSLSYDGEKNLGELGPVIDYELDHDILRRRSWQAYLESEVAQLVFKKYATWIISKGLKCNSEPVEQVLKSEGINIEVEKFNEVAETRWQVWAKSKYSNLDNQRNLNYTARECLKNAIVGGDVLVILRYIKKVVKTELIDGAHICSPMGVHNYMEELKESGNKIIDGIEMNQNGDHVAYWVMQKNHKHERIPAYNSLGLKVAFLVYGMSFRLDSKRGMPLISTVMETIKKMERYKEATLGSAEERQKIAYQVTHQQFSTGENPLASQLAKAFDVEGDADLPKTITGEELANTVAATTNKQTFNMPLGAELKSLESRNELYFKDFYSVNIDIICAVIGIPPNVAMSLYNDSFSASRAATKDWEHTIRVVREDFANQFYQPIYNFWLHTEILNFKIDAPGYLQAFQQGNYMALEAYRNARFVGEMFPHIDPLKEVNAERAKLGIFGKAVPLTTFEQSTETLGGGDADSNIRQFAKEMELFKEQTDPLELFEVPETRTKKGEETETD